MTERGANFQESNGNPAADHMRLRRKRGATLGFVAVLVLIILMLGVCFYVVTKMLGGGRELANSVDAGTLNVAKQAFLHPSRAARDFPNSDVANNFELLASDGKFRLENYNRLVVQSMIVALNAKEEGTPAAAQNAKKVWDAVNDVARFLRSSHGDSEVMGGHFQSMAAANNLKMMGQNGISLSGYDISYTARGESTNVYFDPKLLSTFNAGALPVSTGLRRSPTGNQFVGGYLPLSVDLSVGTLVFSGVPVSPQDRPHLISGFVFDNGRNPSFMPGYPAQILPPNSFRSAGKTRESHTQTFGGAVASAIVGSLNREYEACIPNGYIEIKNGPSMPPASTETAITDLDIFSHALAGLGIDMTPNRDWFCRGSDSEHGVGDIKRYDTSMNSVPTNLNDLEGDLRRRYPNYENWIYRDWAAQIREKLDHWPSRNLIDRWADVNSLAEPLQEYLFEKDAPRCSASIVYIRHGNGDSARDCNEFRTINSYTNWHCVWQTFSQGRNQHDSPCVPMLDNFKRGYNQYGSSRHNDNGSGFTALERFKSDVLIARKNCSSCVSVTPSSTPSGMKSFDHNSKYPAPLNAHNFGKVETPLTYLKMIDKVENATGCGQGSTIDFLLKRCQQMKPTITKQEVIDALDSMRLALDATLYLYVKDGRLTLSDQRPPAYIAGTTADGLGGTPEVMRCGTEYRVIGNLVNASSKAIQMLGPAGVSYELKLPDLGGGGKAKIAQDTKNNTFSDIPEENLHFKKVDVDGSAFEGEPSDADVEPYMIDTDPFTDGRFPGWCFRQAQDARCKDTANWIPSSGYNNLLGQLLFQNACTGGGQFCQPN